MPYVNVKITRGNVTREQKARVVEEIEPDNRASPGCSRPNTSRSRRPSMCAANGVRGLCRLLAAALVLHAAACTDQAPAPEPALRLEFTIEAEELLAGDIGLLTAVALDEDGNPVSVGPIVLTTDDPAVVMVDASSRLRAVAPGRTMLRGAGGGVEGNAEIEVLAGPALFALRSFDGVELPVLVAADSVDWNGEKEYHEVLVTSGALALTGGAQPGYELRTRYQEFDVRYVDGQRQASLRLEWSDYDRGTIAYDAAGDPAMTSEIIAPLHHRASPVPGGFLVDFRIPGTDEHVDLRYRR